MVVQFATRVNSCLSLSTISVFGANGRLLQAKTKHITFWNLSMFRILNILIPSTGTTACCCHLLPIPASPNSTNLHPDWCEAPKSWHPDMIKALWIWRSRFPCLQIHNSPRISVVIQRCGSCWVLVPSGSPKTHDVASSVARDLWAHYILLKNLAMKHCNTLANAKTILFCAFFDSPSKKTKENLPNNLLTKFISTKFHSPEK